MELNEISKQRIASKVLAAMSASGLLNKEAAGIFDASPAYFSNLRHYAEGRDKPGYVPVSLWEALRTWYYSDKPLKGYKPEEMEGSHVEPDTEAAEKTQRQLDEAAYTGIRKRRSKLATNQLVKEHMAAEAAEVREALHEAIRESVNTEEPTKEEQAAEVRYHYEQVHKVDPNKLDKLTGVLASAELQILPDGSLHITCTYK